MPEKARRDQLVALVTWEFRKNLWSKFFLRVRSFPTSELHLTISRSKAARARGVYSSSFWLLYWGSFLLLKFIFKLKFENKFSLLEKSEILETKISLFKKVVFKFYVRLPSRAQVSGGG